MSELGESNSKALPGSGSTSECTELSATHKSAHTVVDEDNITTETQVCLIVSKFR